MIYAEHNFSSNYLGAVGMNDSFMVRNIIVDELARLIVTDKKDVVNVLRKYNVNVTVNDDNSIISQYVIREIVNNNQGVLNEISALISNNEYDNGEVKNFVNLFGKTKDTSTTKTKGELATKLGDFLKKDSTKEGLSELIAIGLKKSFDKQNAKTTSASQTVLNERLKMNEAKTVAAKKQGSGKKILIISSIVAFLGLATFITIKLIKKGAGSSSAAV